MQGRREAGCPPYHDRAAQCQHVAQCPRASPWARLTAHSLAHWDTTPVHLANACPCGHWATNTVSFCAQCVGGDGFGLLEQEPMLPGDNALQRHCSDGDIARLRELRSADPSDLTTFDKNCEARYITNHSHGPMQDKYNMKQLIKEWSPELAVAKTYAMVRNASEITEDFLRDNNIPEQFMLKGTHGTGMVRVAALVGLEPRRDTGRLHLGIGFAPLGCRFLHTDTNNLKRTPAAIVYMSPRTRYFW